jgi:sugar phosphate isomerase/epimerase
MTLRASVQSWLAVGLLFALGNLDALAETARLPRAAIFRCDVTPPPREPLIWNIPLVAVDDPLWAKGVVLEYGRLRIVLCTFDWCEISNESELSLRETIAKAARTSAARVLIHCVHQHTAPYADAGAHRLLDAAPNPPLRLSERFLDEIRQRLTRTVAGSLARLHPFDQVGLGQARVEQVASTRRLRGADGKIVVRYSTGGKDPALAAAPEGDIDPELKTVTLAYGQDPLVRLHFYASHPQTFTGDGHASADFVGQAREAMERKEAIPQLYFTGCSGDLTVGKYNDGSPRARAELAQRLFTGMAASAAATRWVPSGRLGWRVVPLELPLRTGPGFSEADCLARLSDPDGSPGSRVYEGAMRLAFAQRIRRPLQVRALELGTAQMLFLPGEPMLAFQTYAQQCQPDGFVAVAGYCDCGPGYLCTDAAFEEGGYEPTAANTGPGTEALLNKAIRKALSPLADLKASAEPALAPFAEDRTNLFVYRDHSGRIRPVGTARDWGRRCEQTRLGMETVMGPLPEPWRDLPLELKVLEEVALPRVTRRKITYRTDPGDCVTAYLFLPNSGGGPAPAMLCLHQTVDIGKDEPAGLGGHPDLHYALELAERGYVTLAPDYWTFGDYRQKEYDPYQHGYASGTMKGIWNHVRSLDALESLPEVDGGRLGCIGHSLGGHNALWLAAFDPRVQAVVSSCGFSSFTSYAASPYGGGSLRNYAQRRYLPRIATEYGNDPRRVPFDWPEVLGLLAPRPVFVNAPSGDENFLAAGVDECVSVAGPVYEWLGARSNLVVVHPDTGHSFPRAIRQQAYAFLDDVLQPTAPRPVLACRLANYQGCEDAAWTHLPSIGLTNVFLGAPAPDRIEATRKRLAEHGLTAIVFRGDADLSQPSGVDRLAEQLATCEAMGVRFLFLSVKRREADPETLYTRLRQAGELARQHGVVITLETHPEFGTNGDVQLETMRHVSHPNVRVNFDTGNITFYNRGTDAVTELRKIIDYVATVEVKDHNGEFESWHFPAVGRGKVDFPAVLQILREHHYSGPITLEIEGIKGQTRTRPEIEQDIADSAAYLRSLGDFR